MCLGRTSLLMISVVKQVHVLLEPARIIWQQQPTSSLRSQANIFILISYLNILISYLNIFILISVSCSSRPGSFVTACQRFVDVGIGFNLSFESDFPSCIYHFLALVQLTAKSKKVHLTKIVAFHFPTSLSFISMHHLPVATPDELLNYMIQLQYIRDINKCL